MDLQFPSAIVAFLALLLAAIIVLAIKGLLVYVAITVLKAFWYIIISIYDAIQHLRNGPSIEALESTRSSPEEAQLGSPSEAADPEARRRYARVIADRRERDRNLRLFGTIGTVLLITVVGFVVLGIVAMYTLPASP